MKKLYLDYYYKEDPNILSRQKMEDFHKIIPNLSKNPLISYFEFLMVTVEKNQQFILKIIYIKYYYTH